MSLPAAGIKTVSHSGKSTSIASGLTGPARRPLRRDDFAVALTAEGKRTTTDWLGQRAETAYRYER